MSRFIEIMFEFLNSECNTSLSLAGSLKGYLFGFEAERFPALNQILLELKIFNFYNLPKDYNLGYNILKDKFCSRIRKLISKEKSISLQNYTYEAFEFKWENFVSLYDFRGPDYDPI